MIVPMRLRGFVSVIGIVLLATACTGDDGSDDDPAADETADAPMATTPVVEAVVTAEGDAFWAGDGEEEVDVTDAAVNGDTVLATGQRHDGAGDAAGAMLATSTDGRAWEDVELPDGWGGAVTLVGVAAVPDAGFVAVGTRGTDDAPSSALVTDGSTVQDVALPFPEPEPALQPYRVGAVAASGSTVVAAGIAVEGSTATPDDTRATLAVLRSDDGGSTWSDVELPAEMIELDRGPALVEFAAGGVPVGAVDVVAHGDGFVVAAGPDRGELALWSADGSTAEWTSLGTAEALFGESVLDLLHSHGDDLLAFTHGDDDTTVWRSGDGGATFSPVEVPAGMFGGGGRQTVHAAVTRPDGGLAVVGETQGEPRGGRTVGEPELWVSHDLTEWHRSLTDPGLGGYGHRTPAAVVNLGDGVVVVGTARRWLTQEEVDAAGDQGVRGPIAQDGQAWLVSFEPLAEPEPGPEVEPVALTGFEGDVTVTDVEPYARGLIAVGHVDTDDGFVAAVWTSPDGAAWTRVESPAFEAESDGSERLYAVSETADGLVVVGQAVAGDDYALGVWRSPDGTAWSRVETSGDGFDGAFGQGVAETSHGLIAVGTAPSGIEERYLSIGIWRSTDGGATWAAVPVDAAPFREFDAEQLNDVAERPDGSLLAVGGVGDAEETENGFSYSPQPFLVESADGETWTAVEDPFVATFGELQFGDLGAVQSGDDGTLIMGQASVEETFSVEAVGIGLVGLAREVDGAWAVSEERYRHRPTIVDAVPTPSGVVVVGENWRNAGGGDVLIGYERDGALVVSWPGELLAEGDQAAVGAAPLGDDVFVLAEDTSGDDTTMSGWVVHPG